MPYHAYLDPTPTLSIGVLDACGGARTAPWSAATITESAESPPAALEAVSLSDLRGVDLATVLAGIDDADLWSYQSALWRASEVSVDPGGQRALKLLAIICGFRFRVEDPAGPWSHTDEGEFQRRYSPSDFRGEQTDVLAEFAPSIEHPMLRARITDAVWYNDRRRGRLAALAIDAYLDVVDRRLDGRMKARFGGADESGFDLIDWVERALQLSATINKRGGAPERLHRAHRQLYDRTLAARDYVAFARLAQLGLAYGLLEASLAGPDAESLASRGSGEAHPLARQTVWSAALVAFRKLNDAAGQKRCADGFVDETLLQREQTPGAAAKAYWTRLAIGQLRAMRGSADRIAGLRAELRDLQDASLDEFTYSGMTVDLTEERTGTFDLFEGLSLPDALWRMAIITRPIPGETLRTLALESKAQTFFGSMFGGNYADSEGKTIAETAPAAAKGDPDQTWIDEHSQRLLSAHRHRVVYGVFHPARQTILERFPLEERHFHAIVQLSPFVPAGHEHLFALGFARMWQGDFASAAYLLLPQLEGAVRQMLRNANADTSSIKSDLIQEDRSLSGIFDTAREAVDRVFGAGLSHEIDLLFLQRPGPALRHEIAHGKLPTGACYHHDVIYACWLIYAMTCLPLVKVWASQVATAMEAVM